ncbi:hypothetical protein ACFQT0_19990 [Hymenobacter humi]|uniref:Uncharacterized protein n=1 Tax=Hymenobacter humi TaxID=1411620 RepID=A0ABW2UBC5_9BACT
MEHDDKPEAYDRLIIRTLQPAHPKRQQKAPRRVPHAGKLRHPGRRDAGR